MGRRGDRAGWTARRERRVERGVLSAKEVTARSSKEGDESRSAKVEEVARGREGVDEDDDAMVSLCEPSA